MDDYVKKTKKRKKSDKITFDEEIPKNVTSNDQIQVDELTQEVLSDTLEAPKLKKQKHSTRKKHKKEIGMCTNDILGTHIDDTNQPKLDKKESKREKKRKKLTELLDKEIDSDDPVQERSLNNQVQLAKHGPETLNDTTTSDCSMLQKEKRLKRKKLKNKQEDTACTNDASEAGIKVSNQPELAKKESKRGKKRKKHVELLFDKKIQTDVNIQERSLNYLSKWKHNPNEWKFEKKRQVWLKQNMFNCEKIPNEFWDILTEYFTKSKGNIRKIILDEALKIVDDSEEIENVLCNRARSIIQCLQE